MKRSFVGVLLIVSLSFLFVSATGAKTTITVMNGSWWQDQAPIIKQQYEQLHPDVEIEFVLMGMQDMWNKLLLQLLAHNAPDLFRESTSWVPALQSKGFLAPWDEYVGPDKLIKPEWFASQVLETYHFKGNQWAIPYRVDTCSLLIYNRNMFKEAGLDPDIGPANLKEVKEYAQGLTNTDKGIYGFVWEGASSTYFEYLLQQALWNFGTDIVNKEATKATINNPSAVEAVKFLVSFLEEGLVPQATMAFQDNQGTRFFGVQKAAMFLCGSGMQFTVDEAWPDVRWGEDVGIALMEHPVVGSNTYAMQRDPDHPEESAKFIAWWNENLPELTIRMPASARGGDWVERNPRFKPWVEQVALAKESTILFPEIREVHAIAKKQIEIAIVGEATVQEAMDEAAKQIDKALSP